jgi:hypothetical protein
LAAFIHDRAAARPPFLVVKASNTFNIVEKQFPHA